jgi:hypothetical protein
LVIHHYEETANVKQKQHLKAIHNKIAIEWFAIELHCSAAIMPVFGILIQILAILIENNVLKSRLIFRFLLSSGKKKIEKTIQMKYFKIKSLFFDNEKGNNVHSKVQWFSFFVKENKNQRKEWVCMNLFVYQSVSFLKNFVSIFLHKRKWIQWIREWENEWTTIFISNEKDTLKLSSFSTKKLEIKSKYHQRMNQPNQWKLIFTFLWEFSSFYKEQELWKKNNWNWFSSSTKEESIEIIWNFYKTKSNKRSFFH